MKLRKLIAPLLVGVLAFAIAGCGSDSKTATDTPTEIKIGATAGPHAQVAEAVAKEAQK
ncbi:MAG: methionine ABC transporter substrate-binding protein, partial [Veillonella caviae]|nr:methionine ABC transporter substrate-binding protein [Veillonella caviae]